MLLNLYNSFVHVIRCWNALKSIQIVTSFINSFLFSQRYFLLEPVAYIMVIIHVVFSIFCHILHDCYHNSCSVFSVSYNFLYYSPTLLKFWGSNFSTINDWMSTALFHQDFSEQQLYQSNLVSLILIMCMFLNSPLRHSYSHICNLNFCLIMFYFVL